MFSLKNFIMRGILGMVGSEPDYKVIEYSAEWYDKGVLGEEELEEIEQKIDSLYELPEEYEPEPEASDGNDVI